MNTIYRITKHKYAPDPLSGVGGLHRAGRWHPQGYAVVYAAGSIALAALELLANAEDEADLLVPLVVIPFTFDPSLVESVNPSTLPPCWNEHLHTPETQTLGRQWLTERRSAVLCVPAARMEPAESVYLINPMHPRIGEIHVGAAEAFRLHPHLASRLGR